MLNMHEYSTKNTQRIPLHVIDILGHEKSSANSFEVVLFSKDKDMLYTLVSVGSFLLTTECLEEAKAITKAVFEETGLTHAIIKNKSTHQKIKLDAVQGVVIGW